MNLLLIGYGKMGRAIEQIALQRGHHIVDRIDGKNQSVLATLYPNSVDVALEFSEPQAAYDNIYQCLSRGIPVLSGTTGWLDRREALEAYCQAQQGTFFYAANFSIGMNIFFKINTFLAQLMDGQPDYDVCLEEVHHLEKKDAPSGTALTLADSLLTQLHHKQRWQLGPTDQPEVLPIIAKREQEVPGTHSVTYTSALDTLQIQHTAHSRAAFALGAVLVAEWMPGQRGLLGMDDFLQLVGASAGQIHQRTS